MIMTHLQPPVSQQSLVLDIFFGCYLTDNGGTNQWPWLNDGGPSGMFHAMDQYLGARGQW